MPLQKGSFLPSVLVFFGLLQIATALVIRHDTTYENYARTVPIWNTSTPSFRANDTDFGLSGASAIDIALVQAAAPTSAQAIAPLYTGTDEVGRVCNMVSAANNRRDGNGNDRRPENEANSISNRPTETTWAADNMVDQVNGQSLGSPRQRSFARRRRQSK